MNKLKTDASTLIHDADLDATFISASIDYPVLPYAPVITVTTEFKDPSVALNNILSLYPDYSVNSIFGFYFGRSSAGFTKQQIIDLGLNTSFDNYQFYVIPQLVDTVIEIGSAYYFVSVQVPTFIVDPQSGVATQSLQYVFMPTTDVPMSDTIAAVQMFSYAPIVNAVLITDDGTTNPSISLSNGGDHTVFNSLANATLPSDVFFLSFADFDGNARTYTAADLHLSGQ